MRRRPDRGCAELMAAHVPQALWSMSVRLAAAAAVAGVAGALWSSRLQGQSSVNQLNGIAERYVKLVLAVGQHDAAYVDAYYGPAEWKTEAERQKPPLADIDRRADALIREAVGVPAASGDELARLRHEYLVR